MLLFLFLIDVHLRYHISIIRDADVLNFFTFHYYLLLSKNRLLNISEE